jgi:hypothetical protein
MKKLYSGGEFILQYFKKELWLAFNSDKDDQNEHDEWIRNIKEYKVQLENLENRLSKRNFNFFTKESLHDGNIVAINIKDAIAERAKQKKPWKNIFNPVTIEIQVINYEEDKLYFLKYNSVRKIKLDFPSESPLFWSVGSGLEDWGYDELTMVNEEYLAHRILLSSGSEILIEFKKFTYKVEKIKNI